MRRRNGEKKKIVTLLHIWDFVCTGLMLLWMLLLLRTRPHYQRKKLTALARAIMICGVDRTFICLLFLSVAFFYLFHGTFVCVLALTPFDSDNDRDGTNGDGCANVLELVLVRLLAYSYTLRYCCCRYSILLWQSAGFSVCIRILVLQNINE